MSLVSIILPTYNEREAICSILNELLEVANGEALDVELIVVDDSSPDGTAAAVAVSFASEPAVRLCTRTERGLAGAVRFGAELAQGDIIVVMDTDGNHEPALVPELVHTLDRADVVVGSRYMRGGGMPTSRLRYALSLAFNSWACAVLRLPIADCLSGFLCFRRALLAEMDRDKIFVGYGDYAIRLLYWAVRRGRKVLEVPAIYGRRRGGVSKTSFVSIFCRYSLIIVRLRFSGLAVKPS